MSTTTVTSTTRPPFSAVSPAFAAITTPDAFVYWTITAPSGRMTTRRGQVQDHVTLGVPVQSGHVLVASDGVLYQPHVVALRPVSSPAA